LRQSWSSRRSGGGASPVSEPQPEPPLADHPPGKLSVLSFSALALERVLALVLVAVVAALFGATGASSTYFLALIVPITLGVSTSEAFYTALLPRFTRRTRPPRELLHASLRIAGVFVLAGTALYIAILVAVSPDRLSVWLAFSPIVAAAGLNGVYAAFLTAERRYALAILRVPIGTAIALAVAVVVLPFWESTTALAIAVSAGQLATLALLAIRARGAPRGDGSETITAGSLFASAAAVFASTLLGGQLVIVVERFLASGLVAGAVALLAYARGIALLPVMFAQAVGSGVFPAAAERFKSLEREALERLAVSAMRLSMVAALVSTAYVVICRRELVQVAFERHAFTAADAATTATLVGILAAALTGASLTTSGARILFALGRRREILVVSTAALALYVVAAFALREAYGLNGLATAFSVASTAGGLAVAAVLIRRLGIGLARIAREWILVPAALAAAFTAGALAVWLPFGGAHAGFSAALATAVAVGLGGLAVLAVAIRFARGLEYSLVERALRITSAGGRGRSS
jgi:putative peptidoglycan lipid II flippase